MEGNVLFNDALNTFYLQLYGVRHMVKDYSDSTRGNPLLPLELFFPISSKGSFICTIPQIGEHIPQPLLHQVMKHWMEREIQKWKQFKSKLPWENTVNIVFPRQFLKHKIKFDTTDILIAGVENSVLISTVIFLICYQKLFCSGKSKECSFI